MLGVILIEDGIGGERRMVGAGLQPERRRHLGLTAETGENVLFLHLSK